MEKARVVKNAESGRDIRAILVRDISWSAKARSTVVMVLLNENGPITE
jgi:hypothetical protein